MTDISKEAEALADTLKERLEPLQAAQEQRNRAAKYAETVLGMSGNEFMVELATATQVVSSAMPLLVSRTELEAMLDKVVQLRDCEVESLKRQWVNTCQAAFGADEAPKAGSSNLKRGRRKAGEA